MVAPLRPPSRDNRENHNNLLPLRVEGRRLLYHNRNAKEVAVDQDITGVLNIQNIRISRVGELYQTKKVIRTLTSNQRSSSKIRIMPVQVKGSRDHKNLALDKGEVVKRWGKTSEAKSTKISRDSRVNLRVESILSMPRLRSIDGSDPERMNTSTNNKESTICLPFCVLD